MTGVRVIGILVFSFYWLGCREKTVGTNGIVIYWTGEQATGIFLPNALIGPGTGKRGSEFPGVRLENSTTDILGTFKVNERGIDFFPAIPFTSGLQYVVVSGDKKMATFKIPSPLPTTGAGLVKIYPRSDTLPVNLLKFYIHFPRPMQEGEALQHIRLIRDVSDTVSGVFLDLQPELWNKDRTLLTLWLDPGRIKRGLQPNLLLGPPLKINERYLLVVDSAWRDARGRPLERSYRKNFYTGPRDSTSPAIGDWKLTIPAGGSRDPLQIVFNESLDYSLLAKAIRIADGSRQEVSGSFITGENEMNLFFYPSKPWSAGRFFLEVETRLEDLAGNNLNHLFDAEVSAPGAGPETLVARSFTIK